MLGWFRKKNEATRLAQEAHQDSVRAMAFVSLSQERIAKEGDGAERLVSLWSHGVMVASRIPEKRGDVEMRQVVTGEGVSPEVNGEISSGYVRMLENPDFQARATSDDPNIRNRHEGVLFGAMLLHHLTRLRYLEAQFNDHMKIMVARARIETEVFARNMLEAALDEELPPPPNIRARAPG